VYFETQPIAEGGHLDLKVGISFFQGVACLREAEFGLGQAVMKFRTAQFLQGLVARGPAAGKGDQHHSARRI